MSPLLEIKQLHVNYLNADKKVMAVRDVSLSVEKGDSLGIVGESGSGKSTLAMALLRLLPPDSSETLGEIRFMGKELLKLDRKELNDIRWRHLAVVFQKSMNALSPVHRIATQIEDIYRVHEKEASREQIRQRTLEVLALVNLPERVYNLYPHELSGGMMQRVAIAISLLHHPELLIFDEATTALDVITQGQILDEILEMEKSLHSTRIMISHDMSVIASTCRKIAVMYAGELLESGPVPEVFKNARHPYTIGLMKSFPSLTGERRELRSIPGSLPDLTQSCSGCIFAPRCERATPRCHEEKPPWLHGREGHGFRCWLYGGDET